MSELYNKLLRLSKPEIEKILDNDDIYVSERDLERIYDEELDMLYGPVEICGYTYNSSRALKELDPVAYRCGFLDFTGNDDQFIEFQGHYLRSYALERYFEEQERPIVMD